MPKKQPKDQIVIYKDKAGPQIKVDFSEENVWLTQAQMAELFGKDRITVFEHISNIYTEGELNQKGTIRKFRIVQKEGKRLVKRPVSLYNLDVIISVGYRVKSQRGTQFRIWATRKLRDYIIKGYLINQKRLVDNQQLKLKELEQAHKLIQSALQSKRLDGYEKELLNIISDYTNTWIVLNKYDEGKLKIENTTKRSAQKLKYQNIKNSIERFKARLISQSEASEIFGQEVNNKLDALLGAVHQTYGKKDLYPSLEEKAAHLFYLAIKDHPFVDGNKRIGSLMFILFLVENNIFYNKKGERKINDNALVALALLIAESEPRQKEVMVSLIVNLINRN